MQTGECGEVETQVRAALAAESRAPCDAGTMALAITYAGLVDNAAPAARYAKALDWLSGLQSADEGPAAQHIDTIRTALSAHSVASDIGPKLLAALEALLLSPRARAAAKKAVTLDESPASPLDELRQRRAAKGGAAVVHSAASRPV